MTVKSKHCYLASFKIIKDGAPTKYITDKKMSAYSPSQAHFLVVKEYRNFGYVRDFQVVQTDKPIGEQLTLF